MRLTPILLPTFLAWALIAVGLTGCGESSSDMRKSIAGISEQNEKSKAELAGMARRLESLTVVRDRMLATTGEASKFDEQMNSKQEELTSLKNEVETGMQASEKLNQLVKSLQVQLYKQ